MSLIFVRFTSYLAYSSCFWKIFPDVYRNKCFSSSFYKRSFRGHLKVTQRSNLKFWKTSLIFIYSNCILKVKVKQGEIGQNSMCHLFAPMCGMIMKMNWIRKWGQHWVVPEENRQLSLRPILRKGLCPLLRPANTKGNQNHSKGLTERYCKISCNETWQQKMNIIDYFEWICSVWKHHTKMPSFKIGITRKIKQLCVWVFFSWWVVCIDTL